MATVWITNFSNRWEDMKINKIPEYLSIEYELYKELIDKKPKIHEGLKANL